MTIRIAFLLARHNDEAPAGRVLAGAPGVVVERRPDTVRGADVAFVSFDWLPPNDTPAGFLTVAPELVVEVLDDDASWSEVERKIGEYHVFGVDTEWGS